MSISRRKWRRFYTIKLVFPQRSMTNVTLNLKQWILCVYLNLNKNLLLPAQASCLHLCGLSQPGINHKLKLIHLISFYNKKNCSKNNWNITDTPWKAFRFTHRAQRQIEIRSEPWFKCFSLHAFHNKVRLQLFWSRVKLHAPFFYFFYTAQ